MLFPSLPGLAVFCVPVIFRQWRGKIGILTSNTDENNSHNKIRMKNTGVVIILLYLTPEEIVFRASLRNLEKVPPLGLCRTGGGAIWRQGRPPGPRQRGRQCGVPRRAPVLSLSSSEVENRRTQALGSTSLLGSIWQHPSVENILGYISNNLNQLATSTKFLLLCLALKFLQT